jgi:hypothetical protein
MGGEVTRAEMIVHSAEGSQSFGRVRGACGEVDIARGKPIIVMTGAMRSLYALARAAAARSGTSGLPARRIETRGGGANDEVGGTCDSVPPEGEVYLRMPEARPPTPSTVKMFSASRAAANTAAVVPPKATAVRGTVL